ncbi:unnamed protein product, partial [Durusdinium trenchii]
MGAQGVVTVLPLQQEVLCSRGSNLWLQSLPGDGPLQAFVVEDSTWVLLLRPSSYSLLNFGANSGSQEGTLEGTLVLKGLNSEDLSHALQKATQPCHRLALQKHRALGGLEYVQLFDTFLVHLCFFKDATKVMVQRWCFNTSPWTFPLHGEILCSTGHVAGGPLS